jgi:hypothetical protein
MKKLIIFSLSFILFLFIGYFGYTRLNDPVILKITDVTIYNNESNSEVKYFSTVQQMKSSFGNPASESIYFSEMDETNLLLLTYSNSKFYFLEDKLVDFEIVDSKFGLGTSDLGHVNIDNSADDLTIFDGNFTLSATEQYFKLWLKSDNNEPFAEEIIFSYIYNPRTNTSRINSITLNSN